MQNRNPNTKLGWTTAGREPELSKFDRAVAGMWEVTAVTTWKEEEPSATLQTAELFWELIKDELEAAKEWTGGEGWAGWKYRSRETVAEYKKGAHEIHMLTEGRIKYIGYRAPWIDTTIDLTDGDNLEELMTWIHQGGKVFPLYKKEKRGGLTWVEHPPTATNE